MFLGTCRWRKRWVENIISRTAPGAEVHIQIITGNNSHPRDLRFISKN